MKKYMHDLLKEAKKNNDINSIKALYNGNQNDIFIKFEYAKMLIELADEGKNIEENNKKYEEAKILLIELLETRNENYALFELAKLETKLSNVSRAQELFKELLNKRDASEKDREYAILELGRIEAYNKNIDAARKYFNSLLNTQSRHYAMLELGILEAENGNNELGKKYFYQLINEKSQNYRYALNTLVILFIKENNYEEAIKLIEKYDMKLLYRMSLFLSKELNIFFNSSYKENGYSYSMNQILDYDEYLAIDHIIDRHVTEKNSTVFNKEIDLYKLFVSIKDSLTEENKTNKLVLNDIYAIYYPNIGENGEDYLRVVTLPNTKDILSMYPIKNKYDIFLEENDEYEEKNKNNDQHLEENKVNNQNKVKKANNKIKKKKR